MLHRIKNNWLIITICLIAFLIRLKGITFQSLWLDELGAMKESDPIASWGDLFRTLTCCDIQPPLFFILEKIAFTIFGYTEFMARFISLLAGTAGIYAIYLLGKEISNKQLGLLCAALTTINYYHIYFSQEVRPYIFAFLFATLSFTFFLKWIKISNRNNSILFSLFTLLLLYTHYYGLFVVAAQSILAIVFLFNKKGVDRKNLLRSGLFSLMLIILGYLPWVSFLVSAINYRSFWISEPPKAFLQEYLYTYFGNYDLLNPLLLILLIVFIVRVFIQTDKEEVNNTNPSTTENYFMIILVWVSCVFLIPYVWSLLKNPMLQPRYTIVGLPAIILALAFSIQNLKRRVIQYTVCILFLILSGISFFFVQKYYTTVTKSQFREITEFIVKENTGQYPINNEKTSWYQSFYLSALGSQAELTSFGKEYFIDSLLKTKDQMKDDAGFWLVETLDEKMPDDGRQKALDSVYTIVKEKKYLDASAQLYIPKKEMVGKFSVIGYHDFADGTLLENQKQIVLLSGTIHTKPIDLLPGKYRIIITAMGSIAANEMPHVNVYVNGKIAGNYTLKESMDQKTFEFENTGNAQTVISLEMTNDFFILNKEDRNVFIDRIVLEQIK